MDLEIWIGTIEISYFDWDTPSIRKHAFTVVTTWARDSAEFTEKCNRMLESYGWKLLGVERANRLPEGSEFSDEVEDMLERTRKNLEAITYGRFFRYLVV